MQTLQTSESTSEKNNRPTIYNMQPLQNSATSSSSSSPMSQNEMYRSQSVDNADQGQSKNDLKDIVTIGDVVGGNVELKTTTNVVLDDGNNNDNASSCDDMSRKTSTVSTDFTSHENTPEHTMTAGAQFSYDTDRNDNNVVVNELSDQMTDSCVITVPLSNCSEESTPSNNNNNNINNNLASSQTNNKTNPTTSSATPAATSSAENAEGGAAVPGGRKLSRFSVTPVVLPNDLKVDEKMAVDSPKEPPKQPLEAMINQIFVSTPQTQPNIAPTQPTMDNSQPVQPVYIQQQQPPQQQTYIQPMVDAVQQQIDQSMQMQYILQQIPMPVSDFNGMTNEQIYAQVQQYQMAQQQQMQQQPIVQQIALQQPPVVVPEPPTSRENTVTSRMPETLEQLKIELENITHAHVPTSKKEISSLTSVSSTISATSSITSPLPSMQSQQQVSVFKKIVEKDNFWLSLYNF